MKAKYLLLLVLVITLGSCSTFKSGQTPDDVYYSSVKKYTDDKKKDEIKEQPQEEVAKKEAYNYEDRLVRMKATNYRRWAGFENSYDDYHYNNNCNCNCNQYSYSNYKYSYGYNGYWNNYGNNYYGYRNNYWNNNNVVYIVPKPKYIAPRGGVYNNTKTYTNTRVDNNNATVNPKTNGGGLLNKIFNSGNNNNNNSSPTRSYEPTKSSSSPSSSGGSGGGISRPGRSGN